MSEPPVLPNSGGPPNENPFAPSLVGTEFDPSMRKSHLDLAYWIGFGGLLIGSVLLSLIGFPLGWVGVFTSIAAAIRVPLLQHRHMNSEPLGALLQPIALLFTSLALNVVFLVVAFIAFVAVCLPGTIAFGLGDVSYTVTVVSGLFGLFCFCVMFALSLRLRF